MRWAWGVTLRATDRPAADRPVSGPQGVRVSAWLRRPWKRLVDFTLALGILAVVWPLLPLVALAVRLDLGRPVVFRQVRPGRHGLPFTIYKFRTMRETKDARGRPLSDEQRLTRLGRVLRSASLDELPQLLNVLRGEMSLVGPRPLLTEYLPRYTARQYQRHAARPGITGWAQVGGRNALSWEDKFEMDIWYVEQASLRLDLAILVSTVTQVWRRADILPPGQTQPPAFMGTAAPDAASTSTSHREKPL